MLTPTPACTWVPRLHLEYLPAQAPELNPDEGVWRRTKGRLANGCPRDRFDLALDVMRELGRLRRAKKTRYSSPRRTVGIGLALTTPSRHLASNDPVLPEGLHRLLRPRR